MMTEMSIGEEIEQTRARLGWTQAQLAEALDISWNTVARWERGELEPRQPQILHLALRALELLRR